MAVSVVHAFVNPKADGADATIVRPSNWNELHTLNGLSSGAGAPSDLNGSNGDFYLRSDGDALSTIYQKRSGVWVGII